MTREALQLILRKAQSQPGFARQIYHEPATVFSQYNLTTEEKRALLGGSISAIEECCGGTLSPWLAELLRKYHQEGYNKRRESVMKEINAIILRQDLAPRIHLLKIAAPAIANKAQPGQFVVIRIDETGERIPLTISDWDHEQGTITIVFRETGDTTERLATLKASDSIQDLAGPLGVPTQIEKFGTVVCVVADYGVAAIIPVAQALKDIGNKVIVIARAPGEDLLFQADRLRRTSHELIITTDNVSEGCDFISELVKCIQNNKVDRVICFAPTCIMRLCAATTKPYRIKTMVTLNPIMVDGTGMCGTCRVSIGGTTKFACVDGPEFDGHEVDWNLLMARRCRCSEQRQPWMRGYF
jgi:ferredoxin--NADP+ reductase